MTESIESWGSTWYGPDAMRRPLLSATSGGMWWPAGSYLVENVRLKQLLALSGRWHSAKAIAGFVSEELGELLQAAVSVGSAVEMMAKTLIAVKSAALLADRGDRDSVLMLTGNSAQVTVDALRLRSIGAVEALKLAKHFHAELPVDLPDPLVLRVRNAAIHMALVDQARLRVAVARMTRYVEASLPLLDLSRSAFWSRPALSVVDALLDEAKSEVARSARAKIAAAQGRFATLTRALPTDQVAAVLTALSSRLMLSSDHNEPHGCPVCKQSGWLLCGVEVGPTEYTYDDDFVVTGAFRSRTAYPVAFECPVCQLGLEGDELLEFDFPNDIEIEPEDADEELFEPDEDLYRGR